MQNDFGRISNGLEKIIYYLGIKPILKRNKNGRALYRVNDVAVAVPIEVSVEIRAILRCLPSIDPSRDNRKMVHKGIKRKNNFEFSYN